MNAKSNGKMILLTALAATLTLTAIAWALDDVKIPLDQVPPAAKAAILKHAAGAKITEIEKETHKGVTVYEAEWQVSGMEHEVCVTADGDVIETEAEIPASQAPAAVQAEIKKRFGPNAKVEVERKTFIMYEVEGRADGKKIEFLISPTGHVHEGHDQGDDDHDNDDDDDNDD